MFELRGILSVIYLSDWRHDGHSNSTSILIIGFGKLTATIIPFQKLSFSFNLKKKSQAVVSFIVSSDIDVLLFVNLWFLLFLGDLQPSL